VPPQCNLCHGSASNPAPPKDVQGNSATTAAGVGAHQSHLAPSGWRHPVACAECHVVPTKPVYDPAVPTHMNGQDDLVWGPTAKQGKFDAATLTCTGSYCHGATLGPDKAGTTTNRSPTWNKVDGSQAGCGTACHTLPPGGVHPGSTACSTCHGNVVSSFTAGNPPVATWANAALHIDGTVDIASMPCDACHGAPPATGAHLAHFDRTSPHAPPATALAYGDLRNARDFAAGSTPAYLFGCGNCHPLSPSAHRNGTVDVEVWSAAAPATSLKARSPSGTYDGALETCAKIYCHSSSVENPVYATTPPWTGGTLPSPRCVQCHPSPGGGGHERHATSGNNAVWNTLDRGYACTLCHAGEIAVAPGPDGYDVVDAARHVSGRVDWKFDANDPRLSGGETYSIPSGTVPASDGHTSRTYGACGDVYCHSNVQPGANGSGAPTLYTTVTWGGSSGCAGCHNPPGQGIQDHAMGIASGSHPSHVTPDGTPGRPVQCFRCHNWDNLTWASPGSGCRTWACHDTASEKNLHVNGGVDMRWAPDTVGPAVVYSGTATPGDGFGSCASTYCHSDGTAMKTNAITPSITPVWGTPGKLPCNGCHGNKTHGPPLDGMPAYANGSPKPNSHPSHSVGRGIGCPICHFGITKDGVSIADRANHATKKYGGSYNLSPSGAYLGKPVSFAYGSGSCSNVSCHLVPATVRVWGGT
jgi:predicted CxxxxCH...CXXCH cytochrome family protein